MTMKIRLNAEAYIETITFVVGDGELYVKGDEFRTHKVVVEGVMRHSAMSSYRSEPEKFSVSLNADKQLCEFLELLIRDRLSDNPETFPKKW